jgi:nitroimidazol reductase NimA-like FMN-containing flavoprotein (pyridoxamine 5'-phosphate oxidase superfamily)
MMGILTEEQARHLLQSGLVGRIGCYADKEIYVVPVTYAYHDDFIYAHSREGQKVRLMRKNTAVCFQVDSIENMGNWRSAIAWGEYQELTSESERSAALKILRDRLIPFVTSETVRPHAVPTPPEVIEKERKPVIYRIRIKKITGRFEKAGMPDITGQHYND